MHYSIPKRINPAQHNLIKSLFPQKVLIIHAFFDYSLFSVAIIPIICKIVMVRRAINFAF